MGKPVSNNLEHEFQNTTQEHHVEVPCSHRNRFITVFEKKYFFDHQYTHLTRPHTFQNMCTMFPLIPPTTSKKFHFNPPNRFRDTYVLLCTEKSFPNHPPLESFNARNYFFFSKFLYFYIATSSDEPTLLV